MLKCVNTVDKSMYFFLFKGFIIIKASIRSVCSFVICYQNDINSKWILDFNASNFRYIFQVNDLVTLEY